MNSNDFTRNYCYYIRRDFFYRGYRGFVQRISGDSAAVLFDTHTPWDKMVTFRISDLEEDTGGKQYYKMT